ncbi:MAG: hypothetical protein GY873_40410 [Bosea sp.]|uniref:hypothetical protein n=1 Tax=Bosea sp. (in: a-proteobacteria) TaxID=1871050 RepID=UPI00238C78C4|nr:hypothetical protein [Bosea sp. (in: a-proteobacteria)]MCP4740466.1 hypothetical protein [Bosea sp. (in: a-proteobacteria)]
MADNKAVPSVVGVGELLQAIEAIGALCAAEVRPQEDVAKLQKAFGKAAKVTATPVSPTSVIVGKVVGVRIGPDADYGRALTIIFDPPMGSGPKTCPHCSKPIP